uniref:Likely ortholog of MEF2-activating SAP transcriptional regulator n=1 Tax=Pan troglodytes TaxID=9598 RepID=G2HGK6_PANTR|nr:likely ortholog of MEF2-activating SAP transcriptional regulator [Pan troglodytes]
MAPCCLGSLEGGYAFWMQERSKKEWRGRMGEPDPDLPGFWLEMKKLEASGLRSASLGRQSLRQDINASHLLKELFSAGCGGSRL